MSYFDDVFDEELELSDDERVERMAKEAREIYKRVRKEEEEILDKKRKVFLQNVINMSHLGFIKENKENLYWFHKILTRDAFNEDRYLFACHLGLFCVVNAIDCFGPEIGETLGTLPFGKTLFDVDQKEMVRIVEVLLSLLKLNETTRAIPAFIHCERARHIGDILDWALTPPPAWSDEAFWGILSLKME